MVTAVIGIGNQPIYRQRERVQFGLRLVHPEVRCQHADKAGVQLPAGSRFALSIPVGSNTSRKRSLTDVAHRMRKRGGRAIYDGMDRALEREDEHRTPASRPSKVKETTWQQGTDKTSRVVVDQVSRTDPLSQNGGGRFRSRSGSLIGEGQNEILQLARKLMNGCR